ncbi:aldehyde dehydrogenase [Xylona heveae TC161]|uniref:aldehyde dehydrogenase (NAD(+)) n=1 Tax=Xylona heveae (strain CBS 132557 / TC161) TaxID=1328760 RepID=A0A165H0T8_XYLHT|nr:aldehyde dehydrogenase [Xylona heveae TC161]KZF22844.1 aldehyde dehydrogenase [Xylona heveae TC161]
MTVYPPRQLYYDGKVQAASSGKAFQSIDPSNATPICDIQVASHADVDAAIDSAKRAFPSWSATPPIQRARILQRAAQLLREHNDEIARDETRDTGKAYSETSTVDVLSGADTVEYYANLVGGGGLNGETTQLREDAWVYTKKEALGVCAGIGAWNYPIQIALWKSGPCLAAGNTMVYKPSEFTPLHGETLAKIYTEAGLPAGVFNVIQGAGDVGSYLTSHPGIAKVSFTGQVSTGQKVAGSAAGGMKYVTMELGGKSPVLILPDTNLENAVDGAMMANFYSTGQVCTNGTRVFVPHSLKAPFEKRLVEKMDHVRAGHLMDPNTNFGPLVSKVHYDKVAKYIWHGIKVDQAKLLYGGNLGESRSGDSNTPILPLPQNLPAELHSGYWIPPTVFTDCTDDMLICRDEIFGPVMSILYYDDRASSPSSSNPSSSSPSNPAPAHGTSSDHHNSSSRAPVLADRVLDSLVRRANNTPLGLAAGVFTQDINLAHKITSRLEAGITWINTWGESPAEMSVGGWKLSGLGVENGRQGIDAWTRNKSTLVDMASSGVQTVFAKI